MTLAPDPQTASALAQQLRSGTLTSVDLVTRCFDRIRQHGDPAIFITLTEDSAMQAARESDARRKRGASLSAWDGIPVAWKDLVDIPGTPTTAGAEVRRHAPAPDRPATVAAHCARMGLISLGKTNLSEFAFSGLGLNPHFGTPINPRSGDDPRAPGGSSAGSAVAVAAGLTPVAVGTDTAGSVRVPAAFCGVAGFKSSQTRYDATGVFPLSSSLDSLGSFAHCVADLAAMDALMRGQDPAPKTPPAAADVSIIIPEAVVFDGLDDAVAAQFDAAVARLQTAGVRLSRQAFPIFDEVTALFAQHGTLTVAEAATLHKTLLESDDADLMDQRVLTRMMTARKFTAQDYVRLQWERQRLQAAATETLGTQFLLFPTVAITAPSIATLEADDDTFARTNLLALRNTMLGNYLGMPGVSLPIGCDGAGLPVGALLSGANGDDDRVLAAASTIEKALA